MNIESVHTFLSSQLSANKDKDIPPSYIKMRYQTCECGTTFYSENDLNTHFLETDHKLIIRDISTYQCNICTKMLNTETNVLQHHVMTHQHNVVDMRRISMGKCMVSEHTCEVCGKVLKSKMGLLMHMSTHTGEKPFKCDICDKTFSWKFNLQIHINTHTGARPYACKECPLAFASYSNLRRHIKGHQGIKPYECEICFKRYTTRSDLKTHHNTIHLKIKKPENRKPRGLGRPRMTVTNYHKFL